MANDKKRFILQMLAWAGSGALIFALPQMHDFLKAHQTRSAIRKEIRTDSIKLVRDTIDSDVNNIIANPNKQILLGEYNIFSDQATQNYYRDTTNTAIGREWAKNINKIASIQDYHEVRHAMNYRIMQHCVYVLTPDVFAADEISACVAASLAKLSNMPPLTTGKVSPYISYKLDSKPDFHRLADSLLIDALNETNAYAATQYLYIYVFTQQSEVLRERAIKSPTIDFQTMINEMMTFEINGRRRNLLKLASDDVRIAFLSYMDSFNIR